MGVPRHRRPRLLGGRPRPSICQLRGRATPRRISIRRRSRRLLAPFALLPFDWFFALWTVAAVGVLIWLVRPWPWALGILALPILYELAVGQVHLFIAAAIVVGFRYPAAWALPILTKITPGIALLWFPIRREWRALAIAVGTTLAIVPCHSSSRPSAWFEWITFLTSSTGRGDSLYLRIATGIALVAFVGFDRPQMAGAGGGLDRAARRLGRVVGDPAGGHPTTAAGDRARRRDRVAPLSAPGISRRLTPRHGPAATSRTNAARYQCR